LRQQFDHLGHLILQSRDPNLCTRENVSKFALDPPQLHQSRRQENLPASLLLELICALVHSITLGLLPVNEIKTSGLGLTVDKGTSEPSKEFLGLVVACRLAFCTLSRCSCMADGRWTYRFALRGSRRPWLPRRTRHRQSIYRSSISADVVEMRGTQIDGYIDLLVGPLSLVRAVGSLIVVLSLLRV
jgi:hypothetical protein